MWITFFAIMIAVAICLSVAAFIMQPVYPLGHLRRGGGVIIPWVNLSVTGNGGPCQR